jgi:hypothetical protein
MDFVLVATGGSGACLLLLWSRNQQKRHRKVGQWILGANYAEKINFLQNAFFLQNTN